jgi:ATP-dependent DNA ligase
MINGFRHPDKPIDTAPSVVKGMKNKQWLAQAKYDGWRLQVYVDGPGHVRCLTRMGRPIEQACRKSWTTDSFSESFVKLLQDMKLPAGTVLDAEFVGPRGHLDPAIYIFDMLAWDGEWLTTETYEQRWARCEYLKLPNGPIHLAETVESDFIGFFERLKATWDGKSIDLCEGIVLKFRKGKLKLSRNSCQKSDSMFRLKYRDIRDKRW